MAFSAATYLALLGVNPSGNQTDPVLRAIINALNGVPTTDFNEAVDDRVAALLTAGSGVTLSYNDGANTLTVGTDLAELVQDIVGAMTVAGANVTVTYNDPAGTITIASSGGGGGGGVPVLLSSQTVAAATEIPFASLMSATYDDYQLRFSGLRPGTNGQLVGVQLSTDNGVSYLNTGYESGGFTFGQSTNFGAYRHLTGVSAVLLPLVTYDPSNAADSEGRADLFSVNTATKTRLIAEAEGNATDANRYASTVRARYNTATITPNALRVVAANVGAGGTLTGTVELWGIPK